MIFTFKNRLTMVHFSSFVKKTAGNKKAPTVLASGALFFVDWVRQLKVVTTDSCIYALRFRSFALSNGINIDTIQSQPVKEAIDDCR